MSELITFDKIFDNNDVRKSVYVKEDNTSEDSTMYDPTKNEATQIPDDKKEMINKKIMDLFVGNNKNDTNLKQTPGKAFGSSMELDKMKDAELNEFISIFYSFPFSNSKIKPSLVGASISETIKPFPLKTDSGSKVIYFDENKKGNLATINNYNKDNSQILVDNSTKNKVKDSQLFLLERTSGKSNQFLDEDVYKNYIKYHGKEVLNLLNTLVSSSDLKTNKTSYTSFVKNTSFESQTVGKENIPSEYQTNRFTDLQKLNKSPDTNANDSTTGSPTGSPTSTSASTSTKKQINCEITNAAASGGKKKRRTKRKKTNKRKRKTIKKRKTKKPKKSMKRRKTKRVTFKL